MNCFCGATKTSIDPISTILKNPEIFKRVVIIQKPVGRSKVPGCWSGRPAQSGFEI